MRSAVRPRNAVAAAAVVLISLSACTAQTSPSPVATTSASIAASATLTGAPDVTPIPDAPASDVVIHLAADHVRWDVDTLTAPAEMTWTLEFENRDAPPEIHNFAIVSGRTVADRIFMTPNLQGPATEIYEIPGLPAGTYEFVCTVHPDGMRGTLIVE
ncbi:MAG: cupredoxin domain-containing protein [Acidobacteria bacterium]|nr:cupredoxin domain-containing protein [Acidobacteriota bacterium]